MSNRWISKLRRGFTLIELLVVVAIIAVLIAILLPALARVRFQAKVVKCLANMQQIGTGMFAYMADNTRLPDRFWTGQSLTDKRGRWDKIVQISTWEIYSDRGSWYHQMGSDWALVDRFLKFFSPIPRPGNFPGATTARYIADPRVYYCPADDWVHYPFAWEGTVDPSAGRVQPGWSYMAHMTFNGPEGYGNYTWDKHPFTSGTYPLFCDPVYYLISTHEPRPGSNSHADPLRPPQNVVYTDGHAQTLFPGDRDYYRLDVWW